MAAFKIYGFMKAIQKGNITTHHSKYRFDLVPIRRSSSSLYFRNYHSIDYCEYPDFDVIEEFDDIIHTKKSFTVLSFMFKHGMVEPDVSICNTILDGFIRVNKTHDAEKLFQKMFILNNKYNNDAEYGYKHKLPLYEPDIVTYNTMLKGLCKVGDNFIAIALLRLMEGRGCKPDIVSYNTVINGLCSDKGVVNTIDNALKLFNEMFSIKGIRPNADTYDSLIYAFSKLGRWDDVCKMLKRMEVDENVSLDLKILNIIVHALCKQNKLKDAQGVFIFMRENGYHPNIATFNSFIQMFCSQGGMMIAASETFNLLEKTTGIEPDSVTYNTLIDGYMKDLNEDSVIKMFTEMPKKHLDKVTHFLLSGLLITSTNHHHYQSKSECRDDIKCSYLYHLYMNGNSFDQALDLFDFMDERYEELNSNIQVYNILIFGAINWGKFDVARKLFHELTTVKGLKPDEVTFTLIIRGFCYGGLFKDAKRMYVEMKRSGFLPDGVVEWYRLPFCYLEQPDFKRSACVSHDMSGIPYRASRPPLAANLLRKNLPQRFLKSPDLLMAHVNQSL